MKVNISPGVGIIKIFKALDYEPWFALAEYVDNSISSYLYCCDSIKKFEGDYKLKIEIQLNYVDNTIEIKDNAGGISSDKFEYAFRAAEIPSDTTGLNEFGMGMKTASSWLANRWTVRTKAIGEKIERTIQFNVNEVVENDIHELNALEKIVDENEHYTVITLDELTGNAPLQRDLNKIKKHLASIHRKFIRRKDVSIFINNEELVFFDQEILVAPAWNDLNGENISWKIDIDQKFGSNKRVKGFIGLLSTMSTSVYNGLSLFRRGRVIQGSGDDLYRPKQICGQNGSHQYKRVFGELELEGFNVDFTKGKFQGDKDFDGLLDLLQDFCDSDDMPLLTQARKYRKPQPKESLKEIAKKGVKEYRESIKKEEIKESIEKIIKETKVNKDDERIKPIPEKNKLEQITEELEIEGEKWLIELDLVDNSEMINWIDILEEKDVEIGVKKIKGRLSLIHPFMSSFGTDDIQPFIRLAIGLAISESLAEMSGGGPRQVRRNLNKLLPTVLSR
jgi:hypothetical protein